MDEEPTGEGGDGAVHLDDDSGDGDVHMDHDADADGDTMEPNMGQIQSKVIKECSP